MVENFEVNIIKYFIEDKKFKGFLVQSTDGETKYLDTKDYQLYLKNSGKKLSVRFPNESIYDEFNLDLEKFLRNTLKK
jgi:hypothetical protein